MFTCVGWEVTLCDPIWQVTLRMAVRWCSMSMSLFYPFYTFMSDEYKMNVNTACVIRITRRFFLNDCQYNHRHLNGHIYPPRDGQVELAWVASLNTGAWVFPKATLMNYTLCSRMHAAITHWCDNSPHACMQLHRFTNNTQHLLQHFKNAFPKNK